MAGAMMKLFPTPSLRSRLAAPRAAAAICPRRSDATRNAVRRTALLTILMASVPAQGFAQQDEPPEEPFPATSASSSSSRARSSHSGQSAGGTRIGLGVQAILAMPTVSFGGLGGLGNGLSNGAGMAFVVDLSNLRVEGVASLGFAEGGASTVGLGARCFFVLHQGDRADFSLGAGAGILNASTGNNGGATRFQLEGGAQIRWFMTQNLALTGTAGLGMSFGDGGWALGLGGQTMGTFGLFYYL